MATGRHLAALVMTVASLFLSGCAVSVIPLWQLAEITGTKLAKSFQEAGEARDTVYYAHAPFPSLCIEYNPQTQIADVLPALQMALRAHQIDSRVYESVNTPNCPVWLRYNTQMEWDISPESDRYQAYLSQAALTLQTDKGQVLSSSHYVMSNGFFANKWATTQEKLSRVVSALVTKPMPMPPPPMKRPINLAQEQS